MAHASTLLSMVIAMTALEWGLWLVAFVASGAFFAWLTRAVVSSRAELAAIRESAFRLRAHEHRQNNALQVLLLLQRECAIRLGVPLARVQHLEAPLASSAAPPPEGPAS